MLWDYADGTNHVTTTQVGFTNPAYSPEIFLPTEVVPHHLTMLISRLEVPTSWKPVLDTPQNISRKRLVQLGREVATPCFQAQRRGMGNIG